MKLAVVGSRGFLDYKKLRNEIIRNFEISDLTEIVSGGANGADSLAEIFSREFDKKMTVVVPNWNRYGKSAGMIRNRTIIDCADCVIAFWDGKSKGTKNSIDLAKKQNKPVIVIDVLKDFA